MTTENTPKQTRAEKLTARAEVLRKRIESDTAAFNAIVAELESAARLANLSIGAAVRIKLGRKFADKDTTRIVDAVVVGVKEEEDGAKQYKVQHGSGFDAEIAVVTAAQIVSVPEVITEPDTAA